MSPPGSAPERIVLNGFMGSGKSTVGRCLAELLGWRLVDLDEEIVRRQGSSIVQIFEQQGEAVFRQLEHQALRQSLEEVRRIIAVGGGALVAERNRRLLKGVAISFWLDPGFDLLIARLAPDEREARPLFRDEVAARRLYDQRLEAYRLSDHRIQISEGETADQVAVRIQSLIRAAAPQGR